MKKRMMKIAALVMIFLVISLVIPQGSFIGIGTAPAKAESCGPNDNGDTGSCAEIPPTAYPYTSTGYYTKGYCHGIESRQCNFNKPSITDCKSCTQDGKHWCWTSNVAYCASMSDTKQSDQMCLPGYSSVALQSECTSNVYGASVPGTSGTGTACGPSPVRSGIMGACTEIPNSADGYAGYAYFARGYCSGAANIQCGFDESSIKDCQSCTMDGTMKWCWKNDMAYCAVNTAPNGYDQSCLPGFSPASSQQCSSVPPAMGGTTATPQQTTTPGIEINPNVVPANKQTTFSVTFPQGTNLDQNGAIQITFTSKTTNAVTHQISLRTSTQCTGNTCQVPQPILLAVDTYKVIVKADAAGGGTITSNEITVSVGSVQSYAGIDLNPKTFTPNQPFIFTVSFNPPVNLKPQTQVLIQLQGQTSGGKNSFSIGVDNFCPHPDCKTSQISLAADTYKVYVTATLADGTPITSNEMTISNSGAPQQQQPSAIRTCPQCQAAHGKWCINYNKFGYPTAQCIMGAQAVCPTSQDTIMHMYTEADTCPAMQCQDACFSQYTQYLSTRSTSTTQTMSAGLPISACYSRTLQFAAISAQIRNEQGTNTAYLQQPQPLNGFFCNDPDDVCWCSILNLASQTSSASSSITTSHWPPDDAYYVQDPPVAAANDVDCTKRSDATIQARLANSNVTGNQLQFFAAGQPVTIEGDVGYFSNTCNGYQYKCQAFRELTCDYQEPKLSNGYTAKLSYKSCPADLPTRIAAEGAKKDFCLGCVFKAVVNIGAIVATIFLLTIPGGQTLIPLVISSVNCLHMLSPVLDGKVDCVNFGAAVGTCGMAAITAANTNWAKFVKPGAIVDSPIAPEAAETVLRASVTGMATGDAMKYWWCSAAKKCKQGRNSTEACGSEGAVVYESLSDCQVQHPTTAQQIQSVQNAAIQMAAYSQMASTCTLISQDDQTGCWSVCAKDSTTKAGAAPRCSPWQVKGYVETQYNCSPRTCGIFSGQTVRISLVYGSSTLMTDTTVTDENGEFSYTFMAPNVDDTVKIMLTTTV